MIRHTLFLLLGLLIINACSDTDIAKLSYSEQNEAPSISLNDPHLKTPLTINAGDIWFQTEDGITHLSQQPKQVWNTGDSLILQWAINERSLELKLEKHSGYYQLNFEASPANDILSWGFGITASEDEYFTGLCGQPPTYDGWPNV